MLDTAAAALVLGVTPATLHRWRRDNTGPPWHGQARKRKGPAGVRYRMSDLHAWLEERKRQPATRAPDWYYAADRVDRPRRDNRIPLGYDRTEGAAAVLDELRRIVREAPSIAAWCRSVGCHDPKGVERMLRGDKMVPAQLALRLGFRCLRIARYERIPRKER